MASMGSMAFLETLREVDVSDCIGVTDAGVACLASCPLQRVKLSRCLQLTDVAARHLSTCETLRSVDLSGCRQLTDAAVGFLATLPNLQEVRMEECWRVSMDALLALEMECAARRGHNGGK